MLINHGAMYTLNIYYSKELLKYCDSILGIWIGKLYVPSYFYFVWSKKTIFDKSLAEKKKTFKGSLKIIRMKETFIKISSKNKIIKEKKYYK